MTTALTDASAIYIAIIAAVTIAMLLALALCRAAAKPAPPNPWDAYFAGLDWDTLADRMRAAGEGEWWGGR